MKNFFIDLKRHFLTGISYMIPLVIAGAVIMGIARIGSSFYGIQDIWDASHTQSAHALVRLFHTMDGIGGLALGLMLPFIAGFIAYSIIDKPGIVPGFVAGLLAKDMNTGFIGALVAGVLAGYIVKLILDKIQLPDFASGITAIFLAPVLGTLITCLIMVYIIGVPIANLNKALEVWLTGMSGTNKIVLAAIVGGMVGFDLGGPVNKAAVTTAMALLASGITTPNTAAQVAIIVPPIGLGLATVFAKKKYDESMVEAGKSSILMGLVGISEGAIPFIQQESTVILPACCLAAGLAGALSMYFECSITSPHGGLFLIWMVNNPLYYLALIVLSTVVGTLLLFIFTKLK